MDELSDLQQEIRNIFLEATKEIPQEVASVTESYEKNDEVGDFLYLALTPSVPGRIPVSVQVFYDAVQIWFNCPQHHWFEYDRYYGYSIESIPIKVEEILHEVVYHEVKQVRHIWLGIELAWVLHVGRASETALGPGCLLWPVKFLLPGVVTQERVYEPYVQSD